MGFAITTPPLVAIAYAQFLFAHHTTHVVGGMNSDIDTWAISQFRGMLISLYATVIGIVAIYWLLTASLGRGQILVIRSANVTMVLSVGFFGCAMAVVSAVPAPAIFLKVACPVLGLSDAFQKFGFDNPTACEAFAKAALPSLLLGLPALLLAISALLRISGSRQCL